MQTPRRLSPLALGVLLGSLASAQGPVEPAPLYVTMVSHFDAPWDMALNDINAFRNLTTAHPDMRWTHLWNPAAYTQATPLLASIETYLLESRDQHGAEIGVHTHMYQSLISAAGVAFQTGPSVSAGFPSCCCDSSGYAVPTSSYSKAEIHSILDFTVDTFLERGLCRPRAYCAGFYTTSMELQEVLADLDFTVSAAAFPPGTEIGSEYGPCWDLHSGWNASVTHLTPPYPISTSTILPGGPAPYLAGDLGTLLEVPQTCKIDWMVTATQMKSIVQDHYNLALSGTPTAVCLAIHDTLADGEEAKFDEVLDFVDLLRVAGTVPVHYVTTSELREAFLDLAPVGDTVLVADVGQVSLSAGGLQTLQLDTCPPAPGKVYGILGSDFGTSPGLPVGGFTLPLNPGPYFTATANTLGAGGPIQGSSGTLGASGAAEATLTVPPGTDPGLVGLTLWHAAGLWEPSPGFVAGVSGAVALELLP